MQIKLWPYEHRWIANSCILICSRVTGKLLQCVANRPLSVPFLIRTSAKQARLHSRAKGKRASIDQTYYWWRLEYKYWLRLDGSPIRALAVLSSNRKAPNYSRLLRGTPHNHFLAKAFFFRYINSKWLCRTKPTRLQTILACSEEHLTTANIWIVNPKYMKSCKILKRINVKAPAASATVAAV